MDATSTPLSPTGVPDIYLPCSLEDQTEILPRSMSQCWSTAATASTHKSKKRKRRANWFPESKFALADSDEDKLLSKRATRRKFSLSLPNFSLKQRGKAPQKDPKPYPSKRQKHRAEKENEGVDNAERENDSDDPTTNPTRRRSSFAKVKDFFSSIRRDSIFGSDKPKLHYFNKKMEPLAQNGVLRFETPTHVPEQPSSNSGSQSVVPYEEPTLKPGSSTYWRHSSYQSRPCTVVPVARNSRASSVSSSLAPMEVRVSQEQSQWQVSS
ncbi:hypothetical protein DM02DRAFT_722960 [Periconia macrospinosa]|uniref:Uncharacterized protein n=1 Tax=Periconia macrospinosa TaxID=97972 RepID=A0A2V1EDI1_9PLEO|nr:hypothetical protein DM02DRAFT_722960 [Periconia macrospinosa]